MRFSLLFLIILGSFYSLPLHSKGKTHSVSFDDELIEGSRGGADFFSVLLNKGEKRRSLIKIRKNFLNEMKSLSKTQRAHR